jgi:hypothetical protein
MEIQRYDIDESKGYPSPVIVPDKLGDYYHADEVDPIIAVLTAENGKIKKCWEYKAVMELEAENEQLREALEKIESMATIETIDIQKIAQAALKQTEPSAFWQDKNGAFHSEQTEGGGE